MEFKIEKARRTAAKLRIGIVGPSGSGKTMTALKIARGIVGADGKICVIDTERRSAGLYADMPDVAGEFDAICLESFSPETYVAALEHIARSNYDAVIIDSLSHAWAGKDGALEMVDAVSKRNRAGNTFTSWREVTPLHNQMVDAILQSPMHVIATMRSKTEYVLEEDDRGKKVPRKIGMQPIQRDGLEYEFTVVGDMDAENSLTVSKSRCSALQGKVFRKPGADVARILTDWLNSAAPEASTQITPPLHRSAATAPPANYDREARKSAYAAITAAMKEHEIDKPTAADVARRAFEDDLQNLCIEDLQRVPDALRAYAESLRATLDGGPIDEPPPATDEPFAADPPTQDDLEF